MPVHNFIIEQMYAPCQVRIWFEMGFGTMLCLTGVGADIGILCKQRWSLLLAMIKLVGFLGCLFVAVWQFSLITVGVPANSPQYTGMIIGLVIALLVRIMFMGLFLSAVYVFYRWLQDSRVESYAANRG